MGSRTLLHKIEWDDHKKEIIEEQQYLFENSLECDCVLISAQGKRLQAHQVVLSSSSEFFRRILSELPPMTEPPIIHMPDAETCVLESILKFIYSGETTVDSDYLTSLLEFCNILNIKGCVANGFTLNGSNFKSKNDATEKSTNETNKKSSDSWSSEEYLVLTQPVSGNADEDLTENNEPDYLEEYLEDDALVEVKEEDMLSFNDYDGSRNENTETEEFITYEMENQANAIEILSSNSKANTTLVDKRSFQPATRSTNSDIDKALNEVNNGKTIHQLSVEYKVPRSTLYHRFRNNDFLKQNYRSDRKSKLNSAVNAVLHERLSLKTAADRYQLPKTAIWREVRKCEQYQPSTKEITTERQNAQLEILTGKSLTSISAKYGMN